MVLIVAAASMSSSMFEPHRDSVTLVDSAVELPLLLEKDSLPVDQNWYSLTKVIGKV